MSAVEATGPTGVPTRITGVFNITPTPFHPDGSLDEASVRTVTRFTIDRGVDGMTVLGVMGEADKLTDGERDRVLAGTVEAAQGQIPICVGISHAGTDGCLSYARRARELGAAAVMVAPPKLSRPGDAALRHHYAAVADAVDLPVVVHDHPPSSGVFMSVEFLAGLAEEIPACRFIKLEDEPTPAKLARLRAANPKAQIFGGNGGLMFLEELGAGAIGTMTGFAFPEILMRIYRAHCAGQQDEAAELFYRYLPLIRFENQPRINLALRKHIYFLRRALACPVPRPPALTLDDRTRSDLMELLRYLGLDPGSSGADATDQSPRIRSA